jgi:tripartite-type tricarboxylate transporter receptor subunit TctC
MTPSVNFARLFALGLTALTLAGIGTASALDYPTRPVRWIVTYPPGGGTDITARIVAQWLSERLGQQFIIENKPGAGNNIGTEAAIHSPADGYTLLPGQSGECDQRDALSETVLQLHPRYRARCRHHAGAERDGGQSVGTGQDGCRVHRLCQG